MINSATLVGDVAVALKFVGVVGAWLSGENCTVITAPAEETDLVVIDMPVTGSTKLGWRAGARR